MDDGKKHCYYCIEKQDIIDYKLIKALTYYISNYKKILPPHYTGLCAKHQRKVASAIKIARETALLPYVRS